MANYQFKYPGSHYVTLTSTSSQEYYPENKSDAFINNLPIPIIPAEFGGTLEVGLVEVYCQPKNKNPEKIFGHHPADNMILVTKTAKEVFFLKKKIGFIEEFLTEINIELEKLNVQIHFTANIVNKIRRVKLYNKEPGHMVSISEAYRTAFGFTQQAYATGIHLAENPYIQAIYDAVPITEKLQITIFKITQDFVRCQEPEELSVVALISEINKSLSSYQVSVIYDGENFEYENEGQPGTATKFPDTINSIFGIPRDYIFEKKLEILKSYSDIDLGVSSNFIVVKTNLIDPQPFNSKLLNALRMFQRPVKTETMVHFTCSPVIYIPVANSHPIENIKVEFCDERFKPAQFVNNTETSLVLHFRTRYF